MTDGWIALHRKIYNSKDFNNQLEVAVFLYLVAMASYKPVEVIYRRKKINLNRGEIAIAYRDLAKRFGLSTRNIITIIKHLVKSGNLKHKLHKRLSIFSIVKYSKYQDVEPKAEQKLPHRTTTNIYNTISSKNDRSLSNMTNDEINKKPQIPLLQSLNKKIAVKKELNEWELMRQKLDADDYEKWILSKLNS